MSKLTENCPICGEKMEEGYVIVFGALRWSKEKMKSRQRILWSGFPKDTIILMASGSLLIPPDPPDSWINQAHRCPNCKLVLFRYKTAGVKTPEELYEQMLYVYANVYGGGKRVLEPKIKSLMKQGLSREEAIIRLAEKEKLIEEE